MPPTAHITTVKNQKDWIPNLLCLSGSTNREKSGEKTEKHRVNKEKTLWSDKVIICHTGILKYRLKLDLDSICLGVTH